MMRTGDVTPNATAKGSPDAAVPTILPPVIDEATTDGDFIDNYDLITDDEDMYSSCEKMDHFCGGCVTPVHWTACKFVPTFYAGSEVSKMATMTKKNHVAACMQIYVTAIDELENEHFDDDARFFFKRSFQKKDDPLLPHRLYRNYLDSSQCKMHNQVLPHYPKDLVSMRSFFGFHETCSRVYVKA